MPEVQTDGNEQIRLMQGKSCEESLDRQRIDWRTESERVEKKRNEMKMQTWKDWWESKGNANPFEHSWKKK
jgi:hypothetical protein